MGNQAGIIIRNVKNELFHSAKRLILNEVKGIECLLQDRHLARLLKCYAPFLVGNKIAENQYDDFDEFFDDVDKVVITASEQVERWLSMTTSSRIVINPRAW